MSRLPPANIGILKPTGALLTGFRPVKSLDMFEGATNNFHDEGLFSISSFGPVGSPERDSQFSYIDIRVDIIHPYLFKILVSLKALYKDVMLGKEYAIWDDDENDLVRSDILNGDTGYQFFMRHLPIIKFKETESEERKRKISVLNKAIKANEITTNKIMVMPAGLRDVEIGADGRVAQPEINEFYLSLLSTANSVMGSNDLKSRVFDVSRNTLQRTFNNLFEYLYNMIDGKRGIIQSQFAARGIDDGTRNVIVSMATPVGKLGDPSSITVMHTLVGLFQTMKGMMPLSIHAILNGWLGGIFENGTHARLINKETLKSELVSVDFDTYDYWTTETGIRKLIDDYGDAGSRLSPVEIADHYVALIYRPASMKFKIFGDIDELPTDEGFDKKDVYPITMCELLYLSGYTAWQSGGVITTRFPFTGVKSTYPTIPRIQTTIVSEVRYPLDEQWRVIDDVNEAALSYPTFNNNAHFDTMAPHFAYLDGLGADFDGDKMSANYVYSKESIDEVRAVLNSTANYIGTDGKLTMSSMIIPVKLVLHNLTTG